MVIIFILIQTIDYELSSTADDPWQFSF